MNKITEMKKELSKVSGVNFHNPTYREIFKRYLGDEADAKDETEEVKDVNTDTETKTVETAEAVATPAEVKADTPAAEANAKEDEAKAETEEVKTEAAEETAEVKAEATEEKAEAKAETAEEKALRELIGEDKPAETNATETEANATEAQTEAETAPAIDINDQLTETQLELALVKAGVREDRLLLAKRLFLPELKAGKSIDEIVVEVPPEWVGKTGGAKGFGMPLGDKAQALTNEEKALKQMGIDPRG